MTKPIPATVVFKLGKWSWGIALWIRVQCRSYSHKYVLSETDLFLLFRFQLITWLEFNTKVCPILIFVIVVANQKRQTDIWVQQKNRDGLSRFKFQVTRRMKKNCFESIFLFSQCPWCPNDIVEIFNLSVVRLTGLLWDLKDLTTVVKVTHLDKPYNRGPYI